MSECGSFYAEVNTTGDVDLAESVVMQAYVQLPLLPRRPDGRWVAPLKRWGDHELRLVERVPMAAKHCALQVEVFDRRTQSVLESRDCEEVEDAVTAFREIVTRSASSSA